jgi:hypothetical protein
MAEVTRSRTDATAIRPAVSVVSTPLLVKPGTRGANAVAAVVQAMPVLDLTLPEEPTEVSHDFNDYSLFLHGDFGIGKSSLSTVEGEVGLFTFDPPRKSQALKQRFIPSWPHMMEYLRMLEQRAAEGTYPYVRVVIDGADMFYRHCQKYTEAELRVKHVSEEKWGRGWDQLDFSFVSVVDRLLALPGGCWFISHSEWKEVKTRRGVAMEKLASRIKPAAREILEGKVDGTFAYTYNLSERVMVVRGDEKTSACCKIEGHFMTPKGRPIFEVPMGDSKEAAYDSLMNAFNNQQWFTTLSERDEALKRRAQTQKGGQPEEV